MNRRNLVLTTICIALLLVGIFSLVVFRKDGQLETVRSLQAELSSDATRALPEAQRREKYKQFREKYEELSEAQRREFRTNQSSGRFDRTNRQIREYFKLPQFERVAFLDQQINEMEKRRRAMSQRAGNEARGRRPGPGRGAKRDDGRDKLTETQKQERRERFRRGFLDGTTPQQRAEMSAYMEALRKRREERGLPEFGRRRHLQG